ARAPFLVVAELSGAAGDARIRAAAAIARADIEELFAAAIGEETQLAFDAGAGAVRARATRRLGALKLSDRPVPVADAEAAARLLAAGAARAGLARLPWSREQMALRQRASYL